ncbi:L(+)-tartrate dehydratase subunit beta [Klebsiella variicola]|uniref:L(+)-tartrate dehydratase subunit beta n=1 Tax=Klebsiella variicola TaxID=244366 RepID=A0A7H4M8F7_KLEVA|nr:L(+)-tartrate dehydratase subunit beta [Klebsiella variicola]
MAKKILTTPIKDEDLADIKAGDIILSQRPYCDLSRCGSSSLN